MLPNLVRIAGGDGHRVLTISNLGPVAEELRVHNSFEGELRYNVLGDFAKLAGEGRFSVPPRARLRSRSGANRSTSA